MKLTPYKAKCLTIELWQYLADHPEARGKYMAPDHIWQKIRHMKNHCPLCELFTRDIPFRDEVCRNRCPLVSCNSFGSPYCRWRNTTKHEIRQNAAQAIVLAVRMWDAKSGWRDYVEDAARLIMRRIRRVLRAEKEF